MILHTQFGLLAASYRDNRPQSDAIFCLRFPMRFCSVDCEFHTALLPMSYTSIESS